MGRRSTTLLVSALPRLRHTVVATLLAAGSKRKLGMSFSLKMVVILVSETNGSGFVKAAYHETTGIAFMNVTGMLFPVIGLGEPEAIVKANFGAAPFKFDIDAHWNANNLALPTRTQRLHSASRSLKGMSGISWGE